MKIGKLCKDIKDLKEIILDNFPETELLPDDQDMEFGYIEPGHGLRGKKEWLSMDDDVTEMLQIHKDKKEVMLWCYSHKEKSLDVPDHNLQLSLSAVYLVTRGTTLI